MSYGEHSTFFKLLCDNFLNKGIVLDVNIGCSLIDQDYLAMFEESTTNTEQLFLASRQTSIGYCRFEPSFFFDHLPKVTLFQNVLEVFICIFLSNIKILFEGRFD